MFAAHLSSVKNQGLLQSFGYTSVNTTNMAVLLSPSFPNITQLRTGSTAAWLFENHGLLAEPIPVKNLRFVEPQY